MFKCMDGIDSELFEKKYSQNKNVLDYVLCNTNRLDEFMHDAGYEICNEICLFLSMCESNFVVSFLYSKFQLYCHQCEDYMFLDFYNTYQNGDIYEYISNISKTDLKILRKCFDDLVFPEMEDVIKSL